MSLLNNKYAIITGANRGIGLGIAKVFAAHGAHVILCARQSGSLDALCSELSKVHPIEAKAYYFDVTDREAIKSFYKQIHATRTPIDILVNNAGVMENSLLGMVTQEQLARTFETNTFSPLYLMQYAARIMGKQQSGSIINISSIVGTHGNVGQCVYSASKAAIIGISLSLAKELAHSSIRVNVVAPGMIDTDLLNSISEHDRQKTLEHISMARIGTVEEVANAALFLASDLSTYITGQVLGVDGGMRL